MFLVPIYFFLCKAMTTTISQPSKDVLEAEVPLEILEQFKILK